MAQAWGTRPPVKSQSRSQRTPLAAFQRPSPPAAGGRTEPKAKRKTRGRRQTFREGRCSARRGPLGQRQGVSNSDHETQRHRDRCR